MKKADVKEKFNKLYINFGEKWIYHASLANLYKDLDRNDESSVEKQIADAYLDCRDEVLCVMNNLKNNRWRTAIMREY